MNQQPLADLIRPKTLDEFVGQKHLVGPDGFVRKLLEKKTLPFPSLIFWGPPGCGKTTLARIIAYELKVPFREFSAVSAKKSQLQSLFEKPQTLFSSGEKPTLVFIDEIHRFSKAQQNVLLGPVESGKIILITATTENPSFTVISPLLSRSQTLVFKNLTNQELEEILRRGALKLKTKITNEAKELIVKISNGDARICLNLLEQATQITRRSIKKKTVEKIVSTTTLRYDRTGDEHYNTISAFIKSMRASDVNAALYYLARMIASGEDPLFIARRMVIFASEDIGMADVKALLVADAVFRACESIGLPECALNLAHGVVYLASCPKDRGCCNALGRAQKDVELYGNIPIPLEILNAPTKLMKDLGYGAGYEKYPKNKSYLPEKLKGKSYLK